MQLVRVRVRIRVRARDRVRDKVTVRVRVRVSVSCAFSEAFVGIAAVGIAACTRFGHIVEPKIVRCRKQN